MPKSFNIYTQTHKNVFKFLMLFLSYPLELVTMQAISLLTHGYRVFQYVKVDLKIILLVNKGLPVYL